jgi:CBS domain-containing protein
MTAERTIRSIIDGQQLITASPTTSVSDAALRMKEGNIGAIMVVDGDALVGVFTERDALFRVVACGLDARATALADVMTANPQTIHPDRSFTDALKMMHDGRFRHLPVVEDGRLVGEVSTRDALGPELEGFVYELLRQDHYEQVLA